MDWLLFGDVGDFGDDGLYRCLEAEYFDRAYLDAEFNETPDLLKNAASEFSDVLFVPLYDVPVSAGHGSFFDAENIIQQVPFDAGWLHREGLHAKDLVCLPIAGDSMAPGLKAADIVLVNRARTGGDGVFVLRLGNALRIKRLHWLADGRLRISSDNPVYEPEYVQPDDLADDFSVIGFCHTKIGRVD